jgi:uncharacterized membrane protein YeaQ/YmgE (transglycosylase-associated protein family)
MTDVVTTAAVCVATGTITAGFCASFGFDPKLLIGGTVGGFLGCLIVQTLIPDKAGLDFAGILKIMVGSVLLATVATLLCSPWVIRTLNLEEVPAGAVRLGIGAVIGACAQPLAIIGRARLIKWFGSVGPKENGNA